MNTKRFIRIVAGVLMFLFILSVFISFSSSGHGFFGKEISLKDVLYKMDDEEIKEMTITQLTADFCDQAENRFKTKIGSIEARDILLYELEKYNRNKPDAPIRYVVRVY